MLLVEFNCAWNTRKGEGFGDEYLLGFLYTAPLMQFVPFLMLDRLSGAGTTFSFMQT